MTRLADCLAEHAGASRLLWIDHLDYIARLLGGGRKVFGTFTGLAAT